jgi:hypothetical protein
VKFLRFILLLALLALSFLNRAEAGCGPGGGMMGGGTYNPGGAWATRGPVFGMYAPPSSGEAQMTRQVINLLNNYLRTQPNLRAGRLTVKGNYWEAEILDRQGRLVNRVLIDPRTGYFYYQK